MAAPGVETIPIIDRAQWLALRRQDVTASDVPAVCGHGLYGSPVKVWAEKRGLLSEMQMTEPMKRGLWGEAAVFEALAWERPDLEVRRAKVYLRDPPARLGCTPDGAALDRNAPDRGLGIIQCKVIAARMFRMYWLADPAQDPHDTMADATPPLAYELQTLTEGMLAGAEWMLLAVLIVDEFRWTLRTFVVVRHAEAEATIRERVDHFWKAYLDPGVQPPIDGERDAKLVKQLYPLDDGSTIDLATDNHINELVEEWINAKDERSTWEDRVEGAATEIKAKLGAHTYGMLRDGRLLSLKLQTRKPYSVAETSFRVLRIKQL